ncbi:MAG: divalent cation transporter [Thiohalophilus sp.]|jgi:ZIP family zinc transporter
MSELLQIILYTALAGACIPLGGFLAEIERIRPNWLENEFRHFVIAFGGGVMLAAVSQVLIPEGFKHMQHDALWITVCILAGGLTFFWFERILGKSKSEVPQLSAMLLDYLPESIALGGIFALGSGSAPLLAVLIGLQNIPEGFNAYRELKSLENFRQARTITVMISLVLLGPLFGLLGWFFLTAYPAILGAIMLFASGGILYLIFQDIAPQSRLNRHWAPPLGAVFGFGFALLGELLIKG